MFDVRKTSWKKNDELDFAVENGSVELFWVFVGDIFSMYKLANVIVRSESENTENH